jgi:hypothetical protein
LSLEFTESKLFFFSILFINLLFLSFTLFYPSMDGAAHLYNSNLLRQIVLGNNAISEFYSISPLPVPNWLSHFVLGIFLFLFPAGMAEKIFIMLYVAGMALSFRYFIKQINSNALFLSILIFPFIYSFLFHLGFYNFSISFLFLFLTLGFYLKNMAHFNFGKDILLFVLLTLTYFSNILIFGFLGLILGLFILHSTYPVYKNTNDIISVLKHGGNRLLLLFLASLPALVFLLLFFDNVTFFPSEQAYSYKQLIKWIFDARPFIIYDYGADEIITQHYFYIILFLFLIPFTKEGMKITYITFRKADVLLIPTLISLLLFFTVPNGSSAGMMSDRYCLISFFFGLAWIVARAPKNNINRVLVLFMVSLHLFLLYQHHDRAIINLDKQAQSIYNSRKHIKANSIVLPINFTDNWLMPHFSNYLGVDKPMVLLENYEASVGWFPVRWNDEDFPKVLLGDKTSINGISWKNNLESGTIRQIDIIMIIGDQNKINSVEWYELHQLLSTDFKEVHHSDDNFVLLYERIQ